jgi:erythromycin esterase-like protein
VKKAEQYYRSMLQGRVSSWNLRDKHMANTLDALAAHLDTQVGRSKIVVWEHNSHIGDARATEQADRYLEALKAAHDAAMVGRPQRNRLTRRAIRVRQGRLQQCTEVSALAKWKVLRKGL